jgi:hypothetical protein
LAALLLQLTNIDSGQRAALGQLKIEGRSGFPYLQSPIGSDVFHLRCRHDATANLHNQNQALPYAQGNSIMAKLWVALGSEHLYLIVQSRYTYHLRFLGYLTNIC